MQKPEEIEVVSWRSINGSLFARKLHPAMLAVQKYRKQMFTRIIGSPEQRIVEVEYDREYAIEWLSRKICKPLQIIGLEEIIALITEAYYFGNTLGD